MRNEIELKPFIEKRFDVERGKTYVLKLHTESDAVEAVDLVFIDGNSIEGSQNILVDKTGVRLLINALTSECAITNMSDKYVYGYMEELA